MNITHYAPLGETLYRSRLANGLTVVVNPRKDFARKAAYLVTGFGSIHTDFTLDGEAIHAPGGTAHYLEHKMFDLPGRDASAEFAALGANPNAFTSYDMTAYYFTCTAHFSDCLRLLLQMVGTPWFTEESVSKERGIIAQEILMYEDSSDSRVFDDLLQGLYHSHPVRNSIAGTVESIEEVTPQILYACHRAFYHPSRMILCVCGDVDAEEVARIAEEVLPATEAPEVRLAPLPPEPAGSAVKQTGRSMDVAMTTFQLGFKCEAGLKGEDFARWELAAELAVEALMGESSELYLRLYEDGLIDSSFGAGVETLEGCAMVTCGGDSDDPAAVKAAVLAQAKRLADSGIGEQALARMKRSFYGSRIKGLDSFESTCFRLTAYHFEQWDYFNFPQVFDRVTEEDLLAFLRQSIREDNCTLSIIDPRS